MTILLKRLTIFSTSIFMLGAMFGMSNQAYAEQKQGHFKQEQEQAHFKNKQRHSKQEHNRYKNKQAHYKQKHNRYKQKWGHDQQKYHRPAQASKRYARNSYSEPYFVKNRHYNSTPSYRWNRY